MRARNPEAIRRVILEYLVFKAVQAPGATQKVSRIARSIPEGPYGRVYDEDIRKVLPELHAAGIIIEKPVRYKGRQTTEYGLGNLDLALALLVR